MKRVCIVCLNPISPDARRTFVYVLTCVESKCPTFGHDHTHAYPAHFKCKVAVKNQGETETAIDLDAWKQRTREENK